MAKSRPLEWLGYQNTTGTQVDLRSIPFEELEEVAGSTATAIIKAAHQREKEAEKLASEVIASAQKNASKLLADATKQSEELLSQARKEASRIRQETEQTMKAAKDQVNSALAQFTTALFDQASNKSK